jgi:5-methylcytosine-specific restriction endonuclease McrA
MSLGNVLLLNADYQPLKIISVERSIGLWYTGIVDLIEIVEGEFIHSPSISVPKPQVVRLKHQAITRKRGRSQFSKKKIAGLWGYHCAYCYKPVKGRDATIDHVIPRARGGKDTWENCVLACRKCNLTKGTKSLEELGWTLAIIPSPPDFEMYFFGRIPNDVFQRWIKHEFEVKNYV